MALNDFEDLLKASIGLDVGSIGPSSVERAVQEVLVAPVQRAEGAIEISEWKVLAEMLNEHDLALRCGNADHRVAECGNTVGVA